MLKSRQMTLLLGDALVLLLSFVLMAVIRFDIHTQMAFIAAQVKLFIPLFAVWIIVFFVFDLYNLRRVNPNPRNVGLLVASIAANVLVGSVFFYLFPSTGISPKTNLILVASFALIFLFVWRRVFYHLFTIRFIRSIAFVGTSPFIADLSDELHRHPQLGALVYRSPFIPTQPPAIPIDLVIAGDIDPLMLLTFSRSINAPVLSFSQSYEALFGKIPLSTMSEDRALSYMSASEHTGFFFLYRLFEMLIALFVLIITSPFISIAIIARLIEDGRPVFIRQVRVGKNGKVFTLYKLRSMIKTAELHGAKWADTKDMRITPLGHILRKTHIDELPQMINVIKGDIALVGPRPERPEFVARLEKEIPYYFLRHTVRPGFTGWAQIKYRYARTVDDSREKFEYDLFYLKNKNPLLDIGIALKTLQIIFTHV